jgi:hypothetical protein
MKTDGEIEWLAKELWHYLRAGYPLVSFPGFVTENQKDFWVRAVRFVLGEQHEKAQGGKGEAVPFDARLDALHSQRLAANSIEEMDYAARCFAAYCRELNQKLSASEASREASEKRVREL